MKKFLVLTCFSFLLFNDVFAQRPASDTLHVQAFTYGHSRDSVIAFPTDTDQYEKVLMYHRLKCVPGNNPACGEWDYLTYTYAYKNTGKLDSNLLMHPNFLWLSNSPDSLDYSNNPNYSVYQNKHYWMVYDSTISETIGTIGMGNQALNHTFQGNLKSNRVQYLWQASELSAAGLSAGDIQNIRFNLSNLGSNLNNLKIKIKSTIQSDLSNGIFENTNFIEVFHQNKNFAATGWQMLPFINPFYWDGTSNLLIEISFSNENSGAIAQVLGDSTNFVSALYSTDDDAYLAFNEQDYVDVPVQAFNSIDSFITISFWQYGDPNFQPQNGYLFEAVNANNQRVLGSHLPWSNGQVYWDAGEGSGYDRINKASNTSDFAGQWNHWAMVKNVATGRMEIYLNGFLWHSGSGFNRLISGIEKFKIGSRARDYGGTNYDGFIDEFRIWNVALSANEISNWMHKSIDNSHPFYNNLVAYYPFDEVSNNKTGDATLMGMPEHRNIKGENLIKSRATSNWRPNVQLVQGNYVSHLDSAIVLDSVLNAPMSVILFADTTQPNIPTDTIYVWQTGYSYTYDAAGNKIDSVFNARSNMLTKEEYPYFSPAFEVINRWEIARFITPYGIGLDLGDGFTWVYDVTDYQHILRGPTRITSGNWQELLDLRFEFIKGTPPRDIKSVDYLWGRSASYRYRNLADSTNLKEISVDLNPEASQYKIISRITGHGHEGAPHCCEWADKTHFMYLNGALNFAWGIWQTHQCALNAVYPQGGTWPHARAGWCPGDIVRDVELELTPFVTPGSTIDLNYEIDPVPGVNPGQGNGNYVMAHHLISYGDANFNWDAAVEEIIAPNKMDIYNRHNPICGNPIIKIMNKGANPIYNLDIIYGPKGGVKKTYKWAGSLAFLESQEVQLDPIDWYNSTGIDVFEVEVRNPNGNQDEYPANDILQREFEYTPEYPNKMVVWILANSAPHETSYKVVDAAGNIVYSKANLVANGAYKDSLNLPKGCYRFIITDTDGDGISYWANNDGNGYCRLWNSNGGGFVKIFEPDFGEEIAQSFTVGYAVGIENQSLDNFVQVYPNPSQGKFNLDVALNEAQNLEITIYNALGEKIKTISKNNFITGILELDLSQEAKGIYFCELQTTSGKVVKKMVKVD